MIGKIDVLITHKDCADGLGVALVVAEYAASQGWNMPEVIFLQYSDLLSLEFLIGKNVMVADFSFSLETTMRIKSITNEFICMDHHESAEKELGHLDYCHFDMDKSGCVLAWEYLFTACTPSVLLYIQDDDLGKWEIPYVKEFIAGLKSESFEEILSDFIKGDVKLKAFDTTTRLAKGKMTEVSTEKEISLIVSRKAPLVRLAGFDVPCINNRTHKNEVGHRLIGEHQFSIQWFVDKGKVIFVMRSNDGLANVASIAETHGGGGHPNAAAFSYDVHDFDWERFFKGKIGAGDER